MSVSIDIPAAAWQRRLDAVPESPGGPTRVTLGLLLDHLPTIIRVGRYANRTRKAGREPVMDPLRPLDPGPSMGVPLGGIGGGSITRGWQGDFVRWQLQPGVYTYGSVMADQFSAYIRRPDQRPRVQVLYPGRPESGGLSGWAWDMPGHQATYYALFPRAWTVYEGLAPDFRLTCRQVSPVIPHNYTTSSIPAGVFVWTLENTGHTSATVGLMFTFQNGFGSENDRTGGHTNHLFKVDAKGGAVTGVLLRHAYRQRQMPAAGETLDEPEMYEDPLTLAIAAQAAPDVTVTYRTRFVTSGSGMDVWSDFVADGSLENVEDEKPSAERMTIGAAVCATVEVPPGQSREVAFALAWDMPIARFGEGRGHYRRYTRFYGRSGDAAPRIAADALAQYPDWEAQIAAWQDPILEDTGLPDWYKAALFNETYYIVDGGTVWTDGEVGQPEAKPASEEAAALEEGSADLGHFAYLEGHEYRMFNTYDVHFYASFALIALWPELELSLQRDFARAIATEHPEMWRAVLSNRWAIRKVRGIIPHDLGSPFEDPWYKVNAYNFQDASRWKDLNPKFVLQVYRDFVATQDIDFLAEMWDAVVEAMDFMKQFDLDEDGLIENEGFPDQTYDNWVVSGPSAYCGGLWMASLSAAAAIADLLGKTDEAQAYRDMLHRAQESYEELLWTGEYYAYDASRSLQSNSVMADQLAGQWYAVSCGLPPLVPSDHARSALRKIYDLNVMQFEEGTMGAVNGMRPDGRVDTTSTQSQEVWTGVTYALAATMIQNDMLDEAFKTAQGIVTQTYEKLGYWFMTPEAWDVGGWFRSIGYMRPLAIWAMQWAWERRQQG